VWQKEATLTVALTLTLPYPCSGRTRLRWGISMSKSNKTFPRQTRHNADWSWCATPPSPSPSPSPSPAIPNPIPNSIAEGEGTALTITGHSSSPGRPIDPRHIPGTSLAVVPLVAAPRRPHRWRRRRRIGWPAKMGVWEGKDAGDHWLSAIPLPPSSSKCNTLDPREQRGGTLAARGHLDGWVACRSIWCHGVRLAQ